MILEFLKSLSNVASLGVEAKDLIQAVEKLVAAVGSVEAGHRLEQQVGIANIAGQNIMYGVFVQKV